MFSGSVVRMLQACWSTMTPEGVQQPVVGLGHVCQNMEFKWKWIGKRIGKPWLPKELNFYVHVNKNAVYYDLYMNKENT